MSDAGRVEGFSGGADLSNEKEQTLCTAFREIAQVAMLTTRYPMERQPARGEAGDTSSTHFDRLRWDWLLVAGSSRGTSA
jgi:hypothetical protein